MAVSDTAGKVLFTGASFRQEKSWQCRPGPARSRRPAPCRAARRPAPAEGGCPTARVRWTAPIAARPAAPAGRSVLRAAATGRAAASGGGGRRCGPARRRARPPAVRTSRLSSTSCTATSTAFCQASSASSARADCARMPASMRPALKTGAAKASATFEKCTGARSSAFSRRSWRPNRALRKSLGHHWARASAPRSVSAATRASAAIRSGRRLSSSLGWPVPISRTAGHAKAAASSTTRADGLRPSSTASRVCETPASMRSAGTCASSASASARARSRSKALAWPSRSRLSTRVAVSRWAAARRLHDAQTFLGAAQHEVLPRHLAGHQQSRSFHTGRCGRGIGLRRVARRTHAAGEVDLPGHVEAGAQRARVGHALLDRFGQAAVAARGGRLQAHRGPQARALGIATRAGLGDALQRDGHVLIGGQGLVDQRRQRRIAVAGPPGAVERLAGGRRRRPALRKGGAQWHRRRRGLHRRYRAGRQDGQRRQRHRTKCPGNEGEAAMRRARHGCFHILDDRVQ